MKRISSIIFAGVFAFAGVSCTVESIESVPSTDNRVPMEFTSLAPGDDTKTAVSGTDIIWSAGDAINIFDGTASNEFTQTSEPGATGTFSGSANTADEYVALYPYSASAIYSEGKITSELPSIQTSSAANTFDTMLNPSVAKTTDKTLAFSNVAARIKVTITDLANDGVTVEQIQVKATESLAGAYSVDVSGTSPYTAVSSASSAGTGVTLNVGDHNGPYYIVALAGSYTDFTVTAILSNGNYIQKTLGSVTLTRNGVGTISLSYNDATTNANGLYGLFMAGADITIGGTTYNKSQFTDKTYHLTEGTLNHSTSYNGFIVFAAAGTSISLGTVTDLVLIGDDADNKPTITITASRYLQPALNTQSRLVLKNIKIVPGDIFNSYMFTVNQNYSTHGAFGEFTLVNCDITLPSSAVFYSISNARYLEKFTMENCKINIPAGNTNRHIISTGTQENAFSEISVKNNIFYSTGLAYDFRLLNSATNENNKTTVGSLCLENNTFINVSHSNTAMMSASTFGNLTIQKNLMYVDQTITSGSRNFIYARTYPTTVQQCSDNIAYDTNTNRNYRVFYDNSLNGTIGINPTDISENPFDTAKGATFDLTNGEFVPISTCASYGAQR